MRLSLFYQIQVPKPWTAESEAQRIYEALEQIPFAEQKGFSGVWFSEHHFRPVWSHNSAPDLTLAAVRAVSGLAESGFPREAEGRSLQHRFGFVRVPWPDPIRRICANAW